VLRNFLAAQQVDFAYVFKLSAELDQFFEMIVDFDLKCDRNSENEVCLRSTNT